MLQTPGQKQTFERHLQLEAKLTEQVTVRHPNLMEHKQNNISRSIDAASVIRGKKGGDGGGGRMAEDGRRRGESSLGRLGHSEGGNT